MATIISIGLAWCIILIPAVLYLYLFFSYLQIVKNKRNELQRVLALRGNDQYARAYGSRHPDEPSDVAARLLIRNNYATLSYLRAFAFTALLATIISIIAATKAGFPTGLPDTIIAVIKQRAGDDFILAILAGSAGAFVWGLYELLRRYRVGDLTPSTIYNAGIRLLIVGGLGPALSTVLKAEFSWAIAFGLGVLPLSTIADVAAEPTRRALRLQPLDTQPVDASLSWVHGLTPDVVERLAEAGIQSLQQLAYTDPLRLLVRTNLDWKVIIDLVDQAFLGGYVGDNLSAFRPFGIRGAVEFSELNQSDKRDVELVTSILKISPYAAQNLIKTIKEDPTTDFLTQVW
jgi:hypothetical protein